MTIKPCPSCGAKCEEPIWGGVVEFSTHTKQTCYLTCSECPLGCSITVNPEFLKEGNAVKIKEQLFQVWNNFDQLIDLE